MFQIWLSRIHSYFLQCEVLSSTTFRSTNHRLSSIYIIIDMKYVLLFMKIHNIDFDLYFMTVHGISHTHTLTHSVLAKQNCFKAIFLAVIRLVYSDSITRHWADLVKRKKGFLSFFFCFGEKSYLWFYLKSKSDTFSVQQYYRRYFYMSVYCCSSHLNSRWFEFPICTLLFFSRSTSIQHSVESF